MTDRLAEINNADLELWEGTCRQVDPHALVANANTILRFVRTVRRLRKRLDRLGDQHARDLKTALANKEISP